MNRKSAISLVEAGYVSVRGYAIDELIGRVSFGEAVFLLLRGELPAPAEAAIFNAILVSVIDHGVSPPSTIAAVTVANTGAGLNSAVAAGLLAINKFHGGAVEDAMHAIGEACASGLRADEAAKDLVERYRREGRRVSGFGHRFHAADPRTVRLFELADELEIEGKFVAQAKAIESALSENAARPIPINADGAIAALLLELGFSPKTANGIFMIARTPGLVAHAVEEQERNPPMRTVSVDEYEYDGARGRTIDEQ